MPDLNDMRSLLDVLPDPAQVIDLQGRVVLANAKMTQLFGPTEGRKCFHVVSAAGRECRNCPRRCRQLRFVDRQVDVETPDGRTMLVSHSTLDLAGRPHVLECYKDVTEHRRIAREEAQMQAELDMARSIQERCMTIDLEDTGIRCEHAYLPARTAGGDFLNAHVDPQGRGIIAIADVSGHGIAAATITLMLKVAYDQVLQDDVPLEHIPRELNRRLFGYIAPGHFVTLALARFSLDNRQVDLVNAGHPPVLVCRDGGDNLTATLADLPPLGTVKDMPAVRQVRAVNVAPGDRVVLYSDGLFHAFGNSMVTFLDEVRGSGRLPVRGQLDHLLGSARAGAEDDVTILVAEVGLRAVGIDPMAPCRAGVCCQSRDDQEGESQ